MRFTQLLPNTCSHTASAPYICWAVLHLPFSSLISLEDRHLSVTIPTWNPPGYSLLLRHLCYVIDGMRTCLCSFEGSPVYGATDVRCYRTGEIQIPRLMEASSGPNIWLDPQHQEKVKSLTHPIWQGWNKWVKKFGLIKSVVSYFSWGFFPIC